MNKEEKLKRLAEVIKIDATIPAKADFLASHTPFRKIKFTKSGRSAENSEYIDEEQLFQNLFESEKEQHRFVVVQGENGSGKSHLIRWLKEKYEAENNNDNEVILFISRKQSTLKGAIEQLLSSDIFPEDWKNSELKKLFKASKALDDKLLKQNIINQFALLTENDKSGNEILLKNRYKKQLRDLLFDRKFQEFLLREDGPIDRIKEKLNPEDKNTLKNQFLPYFQPDDFSIDLNFVKTMRADAARPALFLAEDLASIQDGPEIRKSISSYLNTKLDDVIQTCTNLSAVDLRKLFNKVRIELKNKGKNLILFIEDITSFTGMDKALIEVLIVEHQSEGKYTEICRICSIIGITDAFFKDSLQDNIKDRITDRVILDEAILNNIDELSEMAARYLNTINQQQDVFARWIFKNGLQQNLPVLKVKDIEKWALIKTPDGIEFSIFPFNKIALQMMYSKLKLQTPRRFIQDIILYIYSNFLKNDDFPDRKYFKDFSPRWKNPLHEEQLKKIDEKNYEKIATLITVWGNGTLTKSQENNIVRIGGLSEEVFRSFRLPFISVSEKDIHISKKVNEIEIEKKIIDEKESEKSIITKKQENEFNSISSDIDDWHKGQALKGFQNIRDEIVNCIFTYIDWDSENISHQIVKEMLPTTGSIGIEGHVFSKANAVYIIKRNNKSRFAFLAIAAYIYLGNKSWNFPDSADYQLKFLDWIISIKNEIISAIRIPIGNKNDKLWPLESWAILTDFYINIIAGNINTNDSLREIYIKILNTPMIENINGRSDKWNKFSNQLSKKNLKGNNSISLNYFNCIQGEITRITNIFYIDAYEILKIIQNYEKKEFDFKKIDKLPDSTKMSENILTLSLKILCFIKDNINQVILEEINNSKNILKKIFTIFGIEITKDSITKTIKRAGVLYNTLIDVNEIFDQTIFDPILNNVIDKNDFFNCMEQYKKISEVKDYKDKIIFCSALPYERMNKYYYIFVNLCDFLNDKLDNLPEIVSNKISESNMQEKSINRTRTLLRSFNDEINNFYAKDC